MLLDEKNYNNVASTVGMKLSKTIEKVFNKGMSALFNEIDKAVRG